MTESIEIPCKTKARGSHKSRSTVQFSDFDRARFMCVKTTAKIILWNRSLSMLANGHRPSAVALHLYEHFGVQIGEPGARPDPERDREVIEYFSKLVIPDNAVCPPTIFDDGGHA
jgi:hypothetical protein